MCRTSRAYHQRLGHLARTALAVSAGLSVTFSRSAGAGTFTWNNTSGGNFSDIAGFVEGVPQSNDFTNQLTFNTGTYTVIADLPVSGGAFDLNNLTFNNTPANTITIGVGLELNTLTLDGPAAGLTVIGDGSATIVVPIAFNGSGAQVTNSGLGTLTLGSLGFANSSNTSFTNAGNGNVTLSDGATYIGSNVTVNLANLGTGLFQIGNMAPISGTLNISSGAVTFAGNTSGDLFGNGLILNVANGASFNFANNAEGMGGITGSGNIILGTAGLTFLAAGDRNYNGSISGTGGVAQDVANVLTLGGPNTYSGTTTIEAGGTIRALAANVFSPSSVINIVAAAGTLDPGGFSQTIAGLTGGGTTNAQLFTTVVPVVSGTITINTSTNVTTTFAGSLAGAGNLAISGGGTQVFLGTNTITGTTSITGGTLRTPYTGLVSSSAITVGSAGTLDAAVSANTTYGLPMSNSGGFIKSGLGTLTFAAANPNVNLSSLAVNAGGVVLNRSVDNGSQIGAAPVLTLGTATLALTGNTSAATVQSFNGVTLGGGGEIDVTAGTGQTASIALGAITRGPGSTVNFNATNAGSSLTTTTTNAAGINTLGAFATYAGTGWATANASGQIVTLASYNAGSFATTTHSDITANLSVGASASTYDVRFNTAATTTVTLSGTNTITDGGILITPTVGAHTSTITGGTGLATPANTDLIINQFNPGGGLTISSVIANTVGTPVTLSNVTLTTSTTFTVPSTTGLYIGEALTAGTNIPASSNAHIVSINSPTSITISDSVAPVPGTGVTVTVQPTTNLVKSGPGTLTLTKTNAFTGVVDLNGGTLATSSAANLGTTTAVNANASAGTPASESSAIYFNGGTLQGTASESTTGSSIQPWIIGPAGGTVNVNSGFTVGKEGNSLYGSGPLTITSSGTGILGFGTNASTFNGPLTINSGIVRFTSPDLPSANGVTINNGGQYQIDDNGVGTFSFAAGTTLTLNGAGPAGYTYPGAFAVTVQSGGGGPASTFPNPIVLASSSTVGAYSTSAASAALILTGTVSGPGSLTTAGDITNGGSVTLSGANTFTGGTNVSSGTLFVTNKAGSATGTGGVNVAISSTLAGTGIVTGPVTVNAGGTIFAGLVNNPSGGGKAAATLTIGSGSILAGTTELDLTAAPTSPATVGAADEIVFGSAASPGVAVFGGSLTVTNPNAITFAAGESFDLFSFGSNPGSTSFASLNLPNLKTGLTWNTAALPATGVLSIVGAAANLTFNNTGGNGDGTTFDSIQQNFNNGSAVTTFNPGDNITFDDSTPNNQYIVKINSPVSPGSITFNNSTGNYSLNGTRGITGTTGLIKNGKGAVTLATSNTYTGDTVINAGSVILGPTGAIAGNVIVNSGAFVTASNTPGSGILIRRIGNLTVNMGATATITAATSHTDRTLLIVSGLSLSSNTNIVGSMGQLDLGNNDLDVQGGSLRQVTLALTGGFNTGGVNWAGLGIESTSASLDTSHLTALGAILNSRDGTITGAPLYSNVSAGSLGLFDGTSPFNTDVLVKYTYYGDANLDGQVDGSDYSRIDSGFISGATGWYNGDFNYDGVVNGSDYTLIDNAFNMQGGNLSAAISNPTALASAEITSAAETSSVPEPATYGLLSLAATTLLCRRKQKWGSW